MAKKVQPNLIDGKALVSALHLPAGTFVTLDDQSGFLTVGALGTLDKASGIGKQLAKARGIFQKASAKWSPDEQAAVHGLFQGAANAPVEAWCMKCKGNRTIRAYDVVKNARGGLSAKGICPTCGTQVYKFLPKGFKSATPITDAPVKDKSKGKSDGARAAEVLVAELKKGDPKSYKGSGHPLTDAMKAVSATERFNKGTSQVADIPYLTTEQMRAYVSKHSHNPEVSKKAQAATARNISAMSDAALRNYCRSAMGQDANVAAMAAEGKKQAANKAATKNAKAPAAPKDKGNWVNVKVGSLSKGKFTCRKCGNSIQAKITSIANGTRGAKALRAYAVCECGANMGHDVSVVK